MNIPGNLQRRPFLAPIGVVALAATAGVFILIVAAWLAFTSTSTTVIVVRQAPPISGGDGDDPPLSADGEARAASLARVLGDARLKSRIAAIYVSAKTRSRATAEPLAQMLGLTPEVVTEDDPRALAHRVRHEHSGDTSLIVAPANRMTAIVSTLSGSEEIPPVEASDYSMLYVITIPRIGRSGVIGLRY